ncbi:MAG TPA: hypothetical protein VMS17_26270, partial [Gemmataceae bacterium]|nr:hypothetical protein [Gemmataceae bacterium]
AASPTGSLLPPEAAAETGFLRRPDGDIEVTYKLTQEDVLAGIRHSFACNKQMARLRRNMLVMWVPALVVGVVMLTLSFGFRAGGRFACADFGLGMGLWITLMALLFIVLTVFPWNRLSRRMMLKQMSKYPNYAMESIHRLTLTPNDLIHATATALTATPWAAVGNILVTEDSAYFDAAGGQLVLPKRACAKDWEFVDFVETARRYASAS